MTIIHKEAFGIVVGDIVRGYPRAEYPNASNATMEPKEVIGINGPHIVKRGCQQIFIYETPVIGLRMKPPHAKNFRSNQASFINDIWQEDGKLFTIHQMEIFVQKDNNTGGQHDMFSPPPLLPEPYPFVKGLDYKKLIWNCPQCGDFNAEPEKFLGPSQDKPYRWHCIYCEKYGVYKILMVAKGVNAYLLGINS